MAHVAKMYFSTGFLYSLCFSGSIVKDKFLTLKKLGFSTKKKQYWFKIDQTSRLMDWEQSPKKKKKKKKKTRKS